jgi:dephospho-CoA kinase
MTGGIACGKSLLSRYLNELGVETLDADDVVHEILPDPAERRRIAAEVFADPAKRKALEAKLHPQVKARIDGWLAQQPGAKQPAGSDPLACRPNVRGSDPLVAKTNQPNRQTNNQSILKVAVIPLLFEAHWDENYDIICCVASSRDSQIERMMATRGMTLAEAEARLAAQMPVEEKARRSHYVVRNDGTAEELREEARKLVDWLTAKLNPTVA